MKRHPTFKPEASATINDNPFRNAYLEISVFILKILSMLILPERRQSPTKLTAQFKMPLVNRGRRSQ